MSRASSIQSHARLALGIVGLGVLYVLLLFTLIVFQCGWTAHRIGRNWATWRYSMHYLLDVAPANGMGPGMGMPNRPPPGMQQQHYESKYGVEMGPQPTNNYQMPYSGNPHQMPFYGNPNQPYVPVAGGQQANFYAQPPFQGYGQMGSAPRASGLDAQPLYPTNTRDSRSSIGGQPQVRPATPKY